MQCPQNYQDAKIKIMFVGNDRKNFQRIENFQKVSIDDAIEKNSEKKESTTRPFASSVNEKVNKNFNGYMVTELFMLGEYTGSRRDIQASKDWEKINYHILQEEMDICAPDCVVFLTQDPFSSDTFLLKELLGSDITFMPNSQCSDITLIKNPKIDSKKKISLMIRVPKPKGNSKYLSNTEDNIVTISSKLIKSIKNIK